MCRWIAVVGSVAVVVGVLALPGAAGAAPLTGVRQVSPGDSAHTCAVLVSGQARCWGNNDDGQLGNGLLAEAHRPVVVRRANGTPLTDVVQIAGGDDFSCALLGSGQVRWWGANAAGQLGRGDETPSRRAVVVQNTTQTGPLTGVRQIALGSFHACAVLVNGRVKCWGANGLGQLGSNSGATAWALPQTTRNTLDTGPLVGVTQLAAASDTTCARLANREARCWGANDYGTLGNDDDQDSALPVAVTNGAGTANLSAVAKVAVGGDTACALLTNGGVRCWGHNENGQVGAGFLSTEEHRPRIVVNGAGNANLTGALDIDGGGEHTCVRVAGRQLRCWGQGVLGELGNGLFTGSDRPVPVKARTGNANLTGVTQFGGGGTFTCARLLTGEAVCWGYNARGGLGNGGTTNRGRPVLVQT